MAPSSMQLAAGLDAGAQERCPARSRRAGFFFAGRLEQLLSVLAGDGQRLLVVDVLAGFRAASADLRVGLRDGEVEHDLDVVALSSSAVVHTAGTPNSAARAWARSLTRSATATTSRIWNFLAMPRYAASMLPQPITPTFTGLRYMANPFYLLLV